MIEVYKLVSNMMDSFKVEGIDPPALLVFRSETYDRMCRELNAFKMIDGELKMPPFVRLTIQGDELLVMRSQKE